MQKMHTSMIAFFSCFVLAISNTGDACSQPVITSVSLSSAPVGTNLTITGSNFNSTATNNVVYFGATRAGVSSATATSLSVSVPPGATHQFVTVTSNNMTAYSVPFFLPVFPGTGSLATGSFAAKADFPIAGRAYGTIIGDFDNDGRPDIASLNDDNKISVLRNTGQGINLSFASRVDFPTAGYPTGIAAGDLDGDGKLDLVATDFHESLLSLYLNTSVNGTISFAPKVDIATGDSPYGVVIGDLNGDGKPDIVSANNELSGYISVFRNTGTVGTLSFASKADLVTGSYPRSLAIADLDGDQRLDLIVPNQYAQSISVFKNTSTAGGSIAFASRQDFSTTSGSYPESVAIGDLDGDSKLDVVVANNGSGTISVFRNTSINTSSISLAGRVDYSVGGLPFSVAIGNIDGDNKPDIAVTNQQTNNFVSVLKNASSPGSLSFPQVINYTTGPNPRSIALGDVNADGATDMVIGNQSASSVSVLKSQIPTILPVRLESLMANYGNGAGTVSWQAVLDPGVSFFTVQHAQPGQDYSDLGSVKAMPNGGVVAAAYKFVHKDVSQGVHYYRLKIVNQDRSYDVSRTVVLNVNNENVFRCYPNPAVGQLTIEHRRLTDVSVLSVVAADGREVMSLLPAVNSQTTTFEVATLNPGIYFISLKEKGMAFRTVTFVKE